MHHLRGVIISLIQIWSVYVTLCGVLPQVMTRDKKCYSSGFVEDVHEANYAKSSRCGEMCLVNL